MSYTFDEKDLRKILREEATEVKRCFTQFSFHATVISSIALGTMFGAVEHHKFVVFAAIPFIALLMTVGRIGIFKYTTANRNIGYELHLNRMATILSNTQDPIKRKKIESAQVVEWEEAVRAWRVIQVAIFRSIYKTPESIKKARWLEKYSWTRWLNWFRSSLFKYTDATTALLEKYKNNHKMDELSSKTEYPWFLPKELTQLGQDPNGKEESFYRAGSFLENILMILFIMQLLLLLPFVYLFIPVNELTGFRNYFCGLTNLDYVYFAFFIFLIIIVTLRNNRMVRRREILENEMLSIHSCSICWQTVIFAHLDVLESNSTNPNPYFHYTEKLAEKAQEISNQPYNLPDFM